MALTRKGIKVAVYSTINPSTGQTLAVFDEISDTALQEVIASSATAFRSWRAVPTEERRSILASVAQKYRDNASELAEILTLEMGKPIIQARGEVELSAQIYQYYADNLDVFLADEQLEISGPGTAVVRTEPIGPLIGIMPWNFPYYQVARFAAPNIALGNTIIVKHARNCPQAAKKIEETLTSAGVPAGVYINAFISSAQVAETIADPRIQGVSLTGSERAGAAVAEVAGRNLKKCVLELGGSDPLIVFDDADLDAAARAAAANRLFNAGQACTATKRIIVHTAVYDSFISKLTEHMSTFEPSDPTKPETSMGPLSSKQAAAEIDELVGAAVSAGAQVVLEGGAVEGSGAYYRPTLLAEVDPTMDVYSSELFGPVGVIHRFETDDQAVDLANDSPYGLAASVYTEDSDRANRVADDLETGMVWINGTSKSSPDLPFGGIKRSGFGRELAHYGFNEFANKKLVRNPRGQ
ncbi:NAD-dependent succinate-semialdehyde dehydrogenase [Citricoccus sp. NR2]|nr:NAD-dependent succinate-semialdehyde dehydrogenase [Citricoccus sp. NR2]WBL20582.1 NAD-dependent succinate-semialdehyde dehydrogenase [Citricoccus sp. NR2]